jgi:phage terminase large subunit
MATPFLYDFKNPDYNTVWNWRIKVINKIRETGTIDAFKEYYRAKPWEFVTHWGNTFDPRNADIGLPTTLPFILFDKQSEWMQWVWQHWHKRKGGLSEKSRDCGLTWCAISFSCTICNFHDGLAIGFGSRKEEYVDKIGDPKCLFWKARMFMSKLPQDFRGSWNPKQHAPHMRIVFPETSSVMTGESGDGIGRGDRQSIYFVDEAAYIERPQLVEASLSATTNCRIDISSVHGMDNPFAQKVHSGKHDVFIFDWRDDPRKDQKWYDDKCATLDPVTIAQEIDRNYIASVEGVVIPSAWIQSAVGAAERLGIEPTGATIGALDVADEGMDMNAWAARKGIELYSNSEWTGKGSDTFTTTDRAHMCADQDDVRTFQYDADGIGAFVRGDSKVIAARRATQGLPVVAVSAFRGSGSVLMPKSEMVKGRKNEDYFQNRKAQAWWALRMRFQNIHRIIEAIKRGDVWECDLNNIISISPKIPLLTKLLTELAQPTYTLSLTGKILVDKAPDGTKSPNLADAVMMVFAPLRVGLFT